MIGSVKAFLAKGPFRTGRFPPHRVYNTATSEVKNNAGVTLEITKGLAIIAALSLLFQIGHFAEHAFQFAIWILGDMSGICGRDTPWMSPWVAAWVAEAGNFLLPAAESARQMIVGMEVLHLIGNSIFLTGLVCLYYCLPANLVRWAVYIEAFHLCEHILLTSTAVFIGTPLGLSTLLGYAGALGGRDFAVGYRVTWHFAMNLLPMPFAMVAIMKYWASGQAALARRSHAV